MFKILEEGQKVRISFFVSCQIKRLNDSFDEIFSKKVTLGQNFTQEVRKGQISSFIVISQIKHQSGTVGVKFAKKVTQGQNLMKKVKKVTFRSISNLKVA